jgi:hypothetical protein
MQHRVPEPPIWTSATALAMSAAWGSAPGGSRQSGLAVRDGSKSLRSLVGAVSGRYCHWSVLSVVAAVSGRYCHWSVLSVVAAVSGRYCQWSVLSVVGAVSGQCLSMVGAVSGRCCQWSVLSVVGAVKRWMTQSGARLMTDPPKSVRTPLDSRTVSWTPPGNARFPPENR